MSSTQTSFTCLPRITLRTTSKAVLELMVTY